MKVYALSDLHLSINNPKPMDIFGEVWSGYLDQITSFWTANITDGDTVLLAGDFSWAMTLENVKPDLAFLAGLPGRKVLIRGNHDYWWHSPGALRAILPAGTYIVQNDCLRIGRLLVCGSRGWLTPGGRGYTDEDRKIYNRELIRLGLSLDAMKKIRRPGDTVIAMMHFPPYAGVGEPSGFTDLLSEAGVDSVVYGHLHGKNVFVKKKLNIGGIDYYLSSCDLIGNTPIEIAETEDESAPTEK